MILSPLMQGRGLKLAHMALASLGTGSPLMQGRGLKQLADNQVVGLAQVAPHAGAWIETESVP